MLTKNNPFSKDAGSKQFFDWSLKGQYTTANEEYSLQRYKELFIYFVSCFRNGKIKMLKKDLFNETWEKDFNHTLGSKVFHLAVTCYLYYVGYREKNSCVSNEQKKQAQDILKFTKDHNSNYFHHLNMQNIKASHIFYFLQESEIMPKNEIGKVLIMPDVCRDYYVYILLLANAKYPEIIKEAIIKNTDINYFRKYLKNPKKEIDNLEIFFRIFSIDENSLLINTAYSILQNILQPLFTESAICNSSEKLKQYQEQFSEQVLANEYKKQILKFVDSSFAALKGGEGASFTISNAILLEYRFLTSFVDRRIDNMSLDSLIFNIFGFICNSLIRKKNLTVVNNINIKNTKAFLDYLEKENLDFLIGSPDILQPHDYRNPEQLERYENNFYHLYTLGWFRDIVALKSNVISVKLENLNIQISIPTIEEMKDDFIEENGLFYKRGEVEKFNENDFTEYIKNTYRHLIVLSDIVITLSDNTIGKYIKCN